MNTQSHALMGAVIFGRNVSARAWAGALGGLAPDVPMLAIVLALKLAGVPDFTIFDEMYWQNWWQVTNAIAHSFLLWGGVLAACVLLRRRPEGLFGGAGWRPLVAAFSASALLHACIDMLVHREDAHMHFWPLTRWKFMSPVSYYDPAHYGRAFGLFELALGLAMCVLLFRRYRHWALRTLLIIAMCAYVAVPAYFIFG
jgi:hypothetical protein